MEMKEKKNEKLIPTHQTHPKCLHLIGFYVFSYVCLKESTKKKKLGYVKII